MPTNRRDPGEPSHALPALNLDEARIKRHSVTISGHRTSVSLEQVFWRGLKAIAKTEGTSVAELIRRLDEERDGSLSGAIRSYVMQIYGHLPIDL